MLKKFFSLNIFSVLILLMPFLFASSCGYNSLVIYNYESYLLEDGIKNINKVASYKEFGDLSDFEQYIKNNKVTAGIGSDYLNAKLAKEGYLEKIDFSKLWPSYTGDPLLLYTDGVKNFMATYDSYLGDVDGDGKQDHLWEYMIPYFIQDKVFAYNVDRGNLNSQEKENGIDFLVEINNMHLSGGLSSANILKVLNKKGYKKMVITDSMRDNMFLGAKYSGNNTELTEENYKNQIDNFIKLFEDNFKRKFEDSELILMTSGLDALSSIISPKSSIGVGVLYNGDALDAYYSDDNFEGTDEGKIKVIRPINNQYLLDAFIIVKQSITKITNQKLNYLYEIINKNMFEGVHSKNDLSIETTAIYKNFDFVNYTPPYKNLYNYVLNNYFINDNGTQDDNARNIFQLNNGQPFHITKENVIWPISNQLQSKARLYYLSKTQK